jgi:hypothetical protein
VTVQSSSATSRIVLNTGNSLDFYKDGSVVGKLYTGAQYITIASEGTGKAVILYNYPDGIGLTVFGTSVYSKHFYPASTETYYLGSTSYYWKRLLLSELLYFKYANIGYIQHGDYVLFRSPASSTDIEVGGHFYPITHDGPYLGKSDRRWYSLYTYFANIDYLGKALNANTYAISNIGAVGCTSVNAGSGTIQTAGKLSGGHLNINVSSASNQISGDLTLTGELTLGSLAAYAGGVIVLDNHIRPVTAGAQLNLGNNTQYFNEIFAKLFTDVGCLGVFDEGVELRNGKKVSDLEALKSIQKHPKLKTTYGIPRFDYKTMPKAVYRAPNTEKGEDGAELTALISIMIGAIKELDNKLKKVK